MPRKTDARKSASKPNPEARKTASRKQPVSFRDRLSRLTYHQACQLLGEEGERLIQAGGHAFPLDPETGIYVGQDVFRVCLPEAADSGDDAIVVLKQTSGRNRQFQLDCDQCGDACLHQGAALHLLLDNKTLLGLAAPPDETVPFELLTREELLARAHAEREERAASERMRLHSFNPSVPWTDYRLISLRSGKSYRVALHGENPGEAYCSCPDFRTNRLGICKHIIHALAKVRKRFNKQALAQPYVQEQFALLVDYTDAPGVRLKLPDEIDDETTSIIHPYVERILSDAGEVVLLVRQLQQAGHDVLIYPDAESWIERRLLQQKLERVAAEIGAAPKSHPLRTGLLRTELLPYQVEGIAFAVGAGRAILADDMGLGKTIQGIGVAEVLAQEAGIERVLIVCPASLKSQWRDEIRRFCGRSVQLVSGPSAGRAEQYAQPAFFTVCNYEQVLRDLAAIEQIDWDLIILDEGQRIKNWESKTSQVIRSLNSTFALVLTGTPLENRLDELYTITRFVDENRLGPAYEFFHRHRIVNDKGRVQGFQHLDEVREKIRPILKRRTRAEVLDQLPERRTTVVRVAATQEQLDLHASHMQNVVRITRKKFLTEMDLLQLRKALLMCRMAANSTFLVDRQEPGYSTKLDRLAELLSELGEQPDRKMIIFSEWRRMLDLIEPLVDRSGLERVRLDGQVPQSQRGPLVARFQEDPDCRAILMTNAGSTGLNLQAANTVINVDLPWNPAVLEQRIGRAHRMGQRNPVNVYLLVTEETLEERLLETLAMKQDLFLAALDPESDVTEVRLESGMEELRRRLEQLLGRQPDAPIDRSVVEDVDRQARQVAERRERVAAAGGQLVGAALQMVGELVASHARPAPDPQLVSQLQTGLTDCLEHDDEGRPQLTVTFPNDGALGQLASTLAHLLVPGHSHEMGRSLSPDRVQNPQRIENPGV